MSEDKQKEKKGWREIALSRSSGEKIYLKSLDGDTWIEPKKLSVKAQQRLGTLAKIQKKEDDKGSEANLNIIEETLLEMMKITILQGVSNHNFKDKDGNKVTFNDNVFEQIIEFSELAIEINKVVAEYNRPLAKETSEKSEMSQNGVSKE